MFDSLKSIVSALKEGAVDAAARNYLNKQIQSFGEVTSLQIDSRAKTIALEASLKGESSPVSVRVTQYEVLSTSEAVYLVLKQFEASRPWIGTVLNQYVAGQKLPIPTALRNLL